MKKSKRLRALAASLLVSLGLLLGMQATGAGPVQATAGGATGCPEPDSESVTCGILTVPENRANPASRTIDLPYVVIPAEHQLASATPLVALAPGLGESAAGVGIRLTKNLGLGTNRDVVILEQRGGAAAEPALDCSDVNDAVVESFTSTEETVSMEGTAVGLALQECLGAFVAEGGDPTGYTIAQTASDVIELRNKLGYPSWTLFGSGSSSTVMSAVASLDAPGSDAVLFDSLSPADRDLKGESYSALQASLDDLSARSGEDGADYFHELQDIAAAFDDDPFTGPVTTRFTGRPVFVELEGNDVVSLVQQLLADPTVVPTLPVLFDRLSDGERGALAPFVALGADAVGRVNWTHYLVSACLDQKPNWSADPVAAEAATPAEGEEAVDPVDPPLLVTYTLADAACSQINLPASATELRVAPAFAQPTLVMVSSNDPFHSAASIQTVSATLPNAQVVTFTGAGHGVIGSSACATETAKTWLAEPGTDVTELCDHDEAALPFLSASSIHETSRAASAVRAFHDLNWLELLVPAIFLAFCVLWLIGWIIAVIARSVQRERTALLVASGISPVSGLAFSAVVFFGLRSALGAEPSLTLVGVPGYFPLLGVLLVVGLFALVLVWKLGSRAAALLVSAAILVWLAMLVWFAWIVLVPS